MSAAAAGGAAAPGGAGGAGSGPLTLTNNAPLNARVGDGYAGTVAVSGGQGPYTWDTVTQLPTGLTASPDGSTLTLSGSDLQEGGNFPLMLEVHDSSVPQRVATERLTINISALQALIISGSLVSNAAIGLPFPATVGVPVGTSLSVLGGNHTYVWGPVTGLPPGIGANVNDTTGTVLIFGTPTTAGTFTLSVSVSDTENPPQTISKTFSIVVSG